MHDTNSGSPGLSNVQSWSEGLGLTHPVLADEHRELNAYVVYGFPTYVIIDREMRIVNADMWPWRDATVTDLL